MIKGNVQSLRDFSAKLRELPRTLAIKVAAAAAPAITEAARQTFSAGEDAFGSTWTENKDGTRATLQRSGALARSIVYVAIGTKLRVVLSVPYAKYLIGKRPIFPRQGDPLPITYVAALKAATEATLGAELGGRVAA